MGPVALRRALPVLIVGVVLLMSAWMTANAQAYVFWGWDAPTILQSGIGRAQQNGTSVSGQAVSVSSRDLLEYASQPYRQLTNDAGVAMDGAYVYWGWYAPTTDSSGIGRAKLSGSGVSGQFISVPGSDEVTGVAVSGNYVYWGWNAPTRDAAGIGRAELNGSHANDNFISVSSRDQIAGLAANGSYVYWAWDAPTIDASGIGRVDLDGSHSNNSFVSVTSRDQPSGLAVNGSYIYWGWYAPTIDETGIGRVELNGSHSNNSFVSFSSRDEPEGVAVDGSYIYWGWHAPTIDQAGIGRADLDGAQVKGTFISVSSRDEIGGIAVGGPPVNSSIPTISGVVRQSYKLTEHHGSWLNGVSSYSYQWERCNSTGGSCTKISGATNSTYTLPASEVGYTIRVQETAKNASGSTTATSAHTSKVLPLAPSNTHPPSISYSTSGAFAVGLNLTEVHGTWKWNPTSYTYQWQLCNSSGAGCAAISGATSQTFALTTADVGGTIRVQETAKNAGGTSTATSAQTPVVLPLVPVEVTPPSIAGDIYAGQTVTEVPASWANGPTSLNSEWLLCNIIAEGCGPINSAIGASYTIPDEDGGEATLAITETATNAGGTSTAAMSPITAVIGDFNEVRGPFAPATDLPPVVVGVGTVGQTLTAYSGAWTGSPPLTYDYEWQLCSSANSCSTFSNIPTAATSTTFTLTAADDGMSVRVVVGATNSVNSPGFNGVASNMIAVTS